MAEPPPPDRTWLALVITAGILGAAVLIAALRLSRAIEGWSPEAPPSVIRQRAAPAEPRRPAPAIAGAGEGRLVLADGEGRLFLFGIEKEEGAVQEPPRLVLHRAYRLRRDPSRHLDDPTLRSFDDWYLDDLAIDRWRRLKAIRDRFEALVATGEPSLDVVKSLEGIARDLAGEGDVPYLTERLDDPSYLARRSAAIALGETGWRRAAPVLIDVISRGDERSLRLVGPILGKLTGIAPPSDTKSEEWKSATERWKSWWETHK